MKRLYEGIIFAVGMYKTVVYNATVTTIFVRFQSVFGPSNTTINSPLEGNFSKSFAKKIHVLKTVAFRKTIPNGAPWVLLVMGGGGGH